MLFLLVWPSPLHFIYFPISAKVGTLGHGRHEDILHVLSSNTRAIKYGKPIILFGFLPRFSGGQTGHSKVESFDMD